ncbi:MAG: hypothetical protein ABIH23_01045 [bacterium]
MNYAIALFRMSTAVFVLIAASAWAQQDGTILRNNAPQFPIGFYSIPENDTAHREMAEIGVNIVRCSNLEGIWIAPKRPGIMGWMPLPLQNGATEAPREQVNAFKDHQALAVWEGPDEVVWCFTALSSLYRQRDIHTIRHAWWHQTPEAVAYAEEQEAVIIANLHSGAKLVRELDGKDRPLWMNEALKSDPKYVRQYIDSFDIIGCDTYPIRADRRPIHAMGVATEHWKRVGREKSRSGWCCRHSRGAISRATTATPAWLIPVLMSRASWPTTSSRVAAAASTTGGPMPSNPNRAAKLSTRSSLKSARSNLCLPRLNTPG